MTPTPPMFMLAVAVLAMASPAPAPPSFKPHYTSFEEERAIPSFKPHYTSFAPPAPSAPSLARREVVQTASVEGGPFSDKPHANISAVAFPTSKDWYTLGETSYVLWSWGELHNPYLRVVLNNDHTKLLPGALTLDDKGMFKPKLPSPISITEWKGNGEKQDADQSLTAVPANMFGVVVNHTLAAAAGKGYIITLHDVANMSRVYATSEPFEIRPAGAKPTVPWPYGTFSPSSSSAPPSALHPSLAVLAGGVAALLASVLL